MTAFIGGWALTILGMLVWTAGHDPRVAFIGAGAMFVAGILTDKGDDDHDRDH